MNTDKKQCKACGWWDIGMKYGAQPRCTQCGAPVNGNQTVAAQRTTKVVDVLGK